MNGARDLKRAIPMVIFISLVLVLSLIVVIITKPKQEPAISNPDGVFMTVGDYTVTNVDLFEALKGDNGINEVLFMTDSFLLKDYLPQVTLEEVNQKMNSDIYGTDDWQTSLTGDEQTQKEQEFNDKMYSNGYRTHEDVYAYYQLQVAKDLYTADQLRNAGTGISDNDVQKYFDDNYQPDVCAIDLTFFNQADVENSLNHFGVKVEVVDNQSVLAWIPVDENGDPIQKGSDNYPAEESVLTDNEVAQLYINLYNYIYQYKTPMTEGIDYSVDSEGNIKFNCETIRDDFVYNYSDLSDTNSSLADYLFSSLDNDPTTDALNYTISTRMEGQYYHLDYKIGTKEQTVTLDDVKNDIINQLIDDQVDGNRTQMINQLREDNNFTIYDTFLELDYSWIDSSYVKTDDENVNVIASVDGLEITTDDLFAKLSDKLGVIDSVKVITQKILKDTPYYAQDITDDQISSFKDLVTGWKTNFSQNAYAQQGFPATYGWKNFIYTQFQVKDENTLVYDLLVNSSLTNSFVLDNFKVTQAQMQDELNKYFAASAEHILYFLDRDFDGKNDKDISEYTNDEVILANQLGDLIISELQNRVDSTTTYNDAMTAIVDEYEAADRADSIWAPFKAQGFNMITESLTGSDDSGFFHNGDMVQSFEDAVKAVWDQHDAEGSHGDDINQLIPSPVETDFGYHVVAVTATQAAPAAEYDDNGDVVRYLPTDDEIDQYHNGDTLPSDVQKAIDTYYTPVYSDMTSTSHVQLALMETYITSSSYSFNDSKYNAVLQEIMNIFQRKIDADEQ